MTLRQIGEWVSFFSVGILYGGVIHSPWLLLLVVVGGLSIGMGTMWVGDTQ